MRIILSISELFRLAKSEADAKKYGTQEDIDAAVKAHEAYKAMLRKDDVEMNIGCRFGDL